MYLLKSIVSIGGITILCRILGFIRDFLIAFIFGASAETDAFFVALKIPNLLRRIFSEGAFSQAFIPILSEYKKLGDIKIMNYFISSIFGILIFIMTFIVGFGVLFSSYLIKLISPGFIHDLNQFNLTKNLLQIMFPYVFLISIVTFYTAILNIWNIIILPTLLPVIFNLNMIIFIWYILPYFNNPIYILAFSVVFSGVFQLLYQFFLLYQNNLLALPRIDFKNNGLLRVYKKFLTAIFGVATIQISLVINNIFASLLVSKSLSWIYYADRLMEFPVAILAVSLTTVLLPLLSDSYVKNKNKSKYFGLLDWGIKLTCLLSIPSAVILAILSEPIVKVLFQYGNFTEYDSLMTSQILFIYSFGLVAFILVKILSLAFYSRHDTITPMKISLLSVIITQLLNVFSINIFKHCTFAISLSLGSWISVILLYYSLHKKYNFSLNYNFFKLLFSIFISVITMSVVIIQLLHINPNWEVSSTYLKVLYLSLICFSSGFCYLFTIFLCGYRLHDFIF
ncbi:murein biosynthesis integral membrane protein MurJ [Buchnera aphidicola (Mollitrichosiphum nigrofasciatum)]|uniref:murein biosynthesis integral membrane protein MurJ n=1 Tax=Buchnera aphidicola TaxID=9 RepID=UPI0031B88F87